METETPVTLSSRKRFWLVAASIVLVTVASALVLFSPFLQARFSLALHGITPADYPRALHTACAHNDIETLKVLSTAGAGLDLRDDKGSTPLHSAVAAGASTAVDILLEKGADQRLVDADGNPPLSLALTRDDLSIARVLLEHGGSPVVPLGKDHRPAPFAAVATGNLTLLRLLLSFDLDADLADQHGVSLLALAAQRKDYEMVETLLGQGAHPDATVSQGVSCLAHAARTGDTRLVELLLDHGADINVGGANGSTPLDLAVDVNRPDMARLLLQNGAMFPAAPPGTPSVLHRAAEHEDATIVRLFLERGVDVEAPFPDGRRLIEYAVDADKRALMRLLLARGAKAGDLVPRALRQERIGILAELLASDASLDIQVDALPPIEWAVRNASPELVEALLGYGADPNLVAREGQSLLALAVALDRPQIVATLVDHGADVDARVSSPASDAFADLFATRYARFYLTKDRGLTALMLAVLRGRQDTVRVLLDRNARLDTPTGKHRTWPIGLAAHEKDVEMMQLLLGRDPDTAMQERQVLVSLADQTAVLYEDGKVIFETHVSTGRKGHETPPGKYVITNKHRRWTSTLYDAPMPYFLRLNAGAIGLHQGVVPRHPASHGCIRVPRGTAERLFASMRVGDAVTVTQESLASAEGAFIRSDDKLASN